MQARIQGELGLSDAGCITVAGAVLVAPPGSRADGDQVHVDGIGVFRIGDWIDTQGGYFERSDEAARPPGLAACELDQWVVVG